MDPKNEVPFAAAFPLPFRVVFLVGLGILGWATNLHGLRLLGIDGPAALGFHASVNQFPPRSPSPNGHLPARPVHVPLYRIFTAYASWCFVCWLLFRAAAHSDAGLADLFRYIPAVCMLSVVAILVCPFDVLYKRERDLFLAFVDLLYFWCLVLIAMLSSSTALRCLFPTSNDSVYFSDVVFADVLTSFAKVLGDLWLSLCMLLPGGSLLQLPSQDGWYRWILPSLMSLPYLIRFRQCLIEYVSPTNTSRRPLCNAIKYASSFPVIFLSAAQRIVMSDLVESQGFSVTRRAWHGEHPLFRLWLISVAINSLYSFWWDLTNDWGLDLVAPNSGLREEQSKSRVYPYGLRPMLLYPLPVYPMAIFLNFILRMTWSFKLSSHLHLHSEGSAVIFCLEVAEVLRRWIWVFLRVEWEVVKKTRDKTHSNGNGVPSDDVELLHAHGKAETLY